MTRPPPPRSMSRQPRCGPEREAGMKVVIRFGGRKKPFEPQQSRTEGEKVIDDTQVLVRVGAGGRSECGPVRAINQDCFAIDDGQRAYLVADGMGGHKAG